MTTPTDICYTPTSASLRGKINHLNQKKKSFELSINDTSFNFLCFSSFVDPGQHGTGRHMEHMLPEIAREDFRKGAQVKKTKLQSLRVCLS